MNIKQLKEEAFMSYLKQIKAKIAKTITEHGSTILIEIPSPYEKTRVIEHLRFIGCEVIQTDSKFGELPTFRVIF